MNHFLEADSVSLEFGLNRILTDIYIQLETGRIVGLLGRNGTEKTCLMNIIYGSTPCSSKSLRLDRASFLNAYKHPDKLKYLPQFNFVTGRLKIKAVFSDFELDFEFFQNIFNKFICKYKTRIRYLSGGQRRLLEVYVIAKSKAEFILLDEPFSYITPLHVEKKTEKLTQ